LINKGFIRFSPTGELDYYVITAKGIWEIEKLNNTINNNIIIEHIDSKFYTFDTISRDIKDKEKVIILTFIACRAYSAKASINLNTDDKKLLAYLEEILYKTFDLLLEYNLFKNYKKRSNLLGNSKTLHPVINLIVHSEDLPKKTRGIFKAVPHVTKYYLDLYKNNEINTKGLGFLLWLIFQDKIDIELEDRILNYCYECNLEYGTKIYKHESLIFTKAEYDDVLKEAMNNYFDNRNKWSR